MRHGLAIDLLIVGGGPAGCAAAIMAARAGLAVRLIEGSRFPRHRPGETLHPGVDPLLAQLGADREMARAGFLRHDGIWVRRYGTAAFVPYGSDAGAAWYGWQAWRATFDALLMRKARDGGVDVRQPCRAISPIVDGGRVVGALTSTGEHFANCVVDATGARRWLARNLQLPVRRDSPPLTVEYGYARGACPGRDKAPLFDDRGSHWQWTSRVRPGLYHWSRTLEPGEQLHKTWMPEEYGGLAPVGKTRAADVTWSVVDSCAGPGYFVCGDSAATLDPSSSHGVLRALMSGILVANLASGSLPEARRPELYRHWLQDGFAADAAALRKSRSSILLPAQRPEGVVHHV